MSNKTFQRNYRMDNISLAYLDAMQKKLKMQNESITHTDLVKQGVAYLANYILDHDEVQNIKMELLFNNFDK